MTKPFNNIIVGVDFSNYSKIVVQQAKLLCHMWDCKLVLVYSVHDPLQYSELASLILPNLISDDAYVTRLKSFYKITNITTQFHVEHGQPSTAIMRVAKKFSHSLIVIGHRGHNILSQFFFGSTAQNLALKSKIPVWIHRGNKVFKPSRFLIPHDLSKPSGHSIKLLKQISQSNPSYYEVFYVNKKPFPILDYNAYQKAQRKELRKTKTRIKNLYKNYPHIPFVASSGDITKKILKRSKDFDVMILSHHTSPGILQKSETINVMRKSKVPVLVTH